LTCRVVFIVRDFVTKIISLQVDESQGKRFLRCHCSGAASTD